MTASDDIDAAWSFDLPDAAIARYPTEDRAASRLMHLPLGGSPLLHHHVHELPSLLLPGDLLVFNDSKVLPARLRGRRATGGKVELLVVAHQGRSVRALARPARKLQVGHRLALTGGCEAEVTAAAVEGIVGLELDRDAEEVMLAHGELPLPPYLGRAEEPSDRERYQTVFARHPGSAAAPTAGLHFSPALLDALEEAGVHRTHVTLHVGLGTFRPLRPEDLARGHLHEERRLVPPDAVAAIAAARERGGRVIAVGTTSARTLESATPEGERVPQVVDGSTDLFIRPGYRFRTVDGLLTNFHLPGSSLLMLVAALVGRERLLDAYATAVARGYRFYSYGDAMLLV